MADVKFGESISFKAIVTSFSFETNKRFVPHYGINNFYLEEAYCHPPANVTVSMLAQADVLNSLAGIKLTGSFHNELFLVDDTKILPQTITASVDYTQPTVANITVVGISSADSPSRPSAPGHDEIFFQNKGTSVLTAGDGNNEFQLESKSVRLTFAMDISLTSGGVYVRSYGLQTSELTLRYLGENALTPSSQNGRLISYAVEYLPGYNLVRTTLTYLQNPDVFSTKTENKK